MSKLPAFHSSPFLFLRLPLEIRNIIYHLVSPYVVDIAAPWKTYFSFRAASCQIAWEYSAIFYSANHFTIDLKVPGNYAKLLEWIYALQPSQIATIKHISIISTLRVWHEGGVVGSRRFCFGMNASSAEGKYVYGSHRTKQIDWVCNCSRGSVGFKDKGGEVSTKNPPQGLKEIRCGRLTAGDVVSWVNVVLWCGRMEAHLCQCGIWMDDRNEGNWLDE